MIVTFLDMEDSSNELNGIAIDDGERLVQILESLRNRPPFLCELTGENGFRLDVGIGERGCAQYSPSNGDTPYLVVVAPGKELQELAWGDDIEFLCGGTPTPVSDRNCVSFHSVREIARYFLETDHAHPGFVWEEV